MLSACGPNVGCWGWGVISWNQRSCSDWEREAQGLGRELSCDLAECQVSQELWILTALVDMISILCADLTVSPEPLILMTCPLEEVRMWG